MTTMELLEQHGIGFNCLSDAYDLGYKKGRADAEKEHLETFEWCHDCKEYDNVQHCCHRWTKQIRDTIEEAKAQAREEAIEEMVSELTKMENFSLSHCKSYWCDSDSCDDCENEIRKVAEQIKEQK